jgi:hypothetical protein
MRVVKRDAALFLEVSERLLEQGYRVRFRAGGASMQPAIGDGDAVILAPVNPVAAQPGDILLYRKNRRGIAHRVVHVQHADEAVVAFLLRGDAEPACDAPVTPDEVLGKVVAVERRDDRLAPNGWRVRLPHFVRRAASRLAPRKCAALRKYAIVRRLNVLWRTNP